MQCSEMLSRGLVVLLLIVSVLVSRLNSSPLPATKNDQQQASVPHHFSHVPEAPVLSNSRRGTNHVGWNVFDIILAANALRTKYLATLRKQSEEDDTELFQGDIVMTRDMRRALRHSGTDSITLPRRGRKGTGRRGKRALVTNDVDLKWPIVNGVVEVPYVIEASSATTEPVIVKAMQHWTSNVPCINFVQRSTQADYLSFFAGVGCYSQVGRIGRKQRISVGPGCEVMGAIAHEIGHALGFWHEHSRPDRDQFIKVLWNNIQSGKEDNFKKIIGGSIDSHGVGYDLNSLMHYGPQAFANAPGVNTIEGLDGTTNFGQRNGLSTKDIEQARLMYCNDCQHIDQNKGCPWWAASGYCNQDTVKNTCKRSCVCNVCEDRNDNCVAYASSGYCTNDQYKSYMSAYCKKSCKLCS